MHEELTPSDAESRAEELDNWKHALRVEFEHWLESLDDIPESEPDDDDVAETPDLYSFYEQLVAATTEARKSNRRTAEAFSQWSDTLTRFDSELRLLREQLARQPGASDNALPQSWCLAFIEITDRMQRLATAFGAPPPRTWLGNDSRWRASWQTQRQGLEILMSHTNTLLAQAGVTRMKALHQPFDPARMSAVVAEPNARWPHNTVIEEIAPGYLWRGDLLRVAQVKVSTDVRPSAPTLHE